MKHYIIGAALAVFAFAFSACSGNSNGSVLLPNGGPNVVYQQVELFARPAVKEGLEVFTAHDSTNRSEPYADTTLNANVANFMTNVAGRQDPLKSFVVGVLSNDEMVFDLSQDLTKGAAYLGVETGGALGRSKFGGRALNDDVVDLDLGVVFGNTIAKATGNASFEDNKESPCLTTDNVGPQNANNGPFPYVDPPV